MPGPNNLGRLREDVAVTGADLLAAIDYCYEQGWTDGLPVVPPTEARVLPMVSGPS